MISTSNKEDNTNTVSTNLWRGVGYGPGKNPLQFDVDPKPMNTSKHPPNPIGKSPEP